MKIDHEPFVLKAERRNTSVRFENGPVQGVLLIV